MKHASHNRWRCRKRGFALLEAIVALTIVAAVGGAAMGMLSAHARAARGIPPALLANQIAENRIASALLLGDDDLALLPDSLTAGVLSLGGEQYLWQMEAGRVDGANDLFRIRAVVRGAAYLELETLAFRPGGARNGLR